VQERLYSIKKWVAAYSICGPSVLSTLPKTGVGRIKGRPGERLRHERGGQGILLTSENLVKGWVKIANSKESPSIV